MTLQTVSMHASYRSDGERVEGYLSRPAADGDWPGVVVIHEWWGLEEYFRDFSRELAAEGYAVLVPDLYGGEVTDDWGEAARLKTSLDPKTAARRVCDAEPYLQGLPFVTESLGLMGFCMGGGIGLLAASDTTADALVAYYPSIYPDAETVRSIDVPVLLHYGLADEVTPPSEVDRLTRLLDEAGTEYDRFEYEGATHAFTNDRHEKYHEDATEEAWPRTLSFLDQHLGSG